MPPTGRDSRRWRAVNAALTALVAGASAVVVTRALLGPEAVLAGTIIGGLALVAGALVSLGTLSARRPRPGRPALPNGRRLRTRVHPVSWFAPVVGSVLAMLAWAGVGHSSGSGWVQAVGALLAAVLITGLVAPLFPTRKAAIRCTGCPSDGEAGRAVELSMVASGPLRIRPRYPVGPVARASGPAHGSRVVVVTITPERRGVVEKVAVELASCAPFGLLWWAREVEVALPRPLHIAPRFGEPDLTGTVPEDSVGDAPLRVPAGIGEPRGVRPYRHGDTRRSVHWPATSHVGSLMVRERERQTDDPIVVDLVLPAEARAAEAAAERVMAGLSHHLVQGRPVVLGTQEMDAHVVRVVRDRIDLGRRLARAVPLPGAPVSGPPPARATRRSRRGE